MQAAPQNKSLVIGPEFEGDNSQVKVVVYGANADNPLVNGVPFWTIEVPQ